MDTSPTPQFFRNLMNELLTINQKLDKIDRKLIDMDYKLSQIMGDFR